MGLEKKETGLGSEMEGNGAYAIEGRWVTGSIVGSYEKLGKEMGMDESR